MNADEDLTRTTTRPTSRLTLSQFEAAATRYDDAVNRTGALGSEEHPEIDIACSSTDWVLPSFDVWAVNAEPWILESPDGFAIFAKTVGDDGNRVLVPPESMWGFASPVISDRPVEFTRQLAEVLKADPSWDLLLLTGLAPDGLLERALRAGLYEPFVLYSGPAMTRCRIDLRMFRESESSKQRRERRRIANRCAEQGVEIVDPFSQNSDPGGENVTDIDALFERILRVEALSWKGQEGSGIIEPTLQQFYRQMVNRLPPDRLRVFFARLDGEDIGYILGHTRGDEYRGLQISYAESHRHLSIGSLLQLAEIERAESTGVMSYDLGMDMAYKQRWATHSFTTRTTAVARNAHIVAHE